MNFFFVRVLLTTHFLALGKFSFFRPALLHVCYIILQKKTTTILSNSTNQIQYSKEDQNTTFEQRHHLCSFTKSNYLLSCPVGSVVLLSLSGHYCNGAAYSFYFTWETIPLNDNASLAIRLAGGVKTI